MKNILSCRFLLENAAKTTGILSVWSCRNADIVIPFYGEVIDVVGLLCQLQGISRDILLNIVFAALRVLKPRIKTAIEWLEVWCIMQPNYC